MTKNEFFKLAESRPIIQGESIYKLTVREYKKDVNGYEIDPETGNWYYEISEQYNWYTTKEKAEEYLHKFINEVNKPYRHKIHSAIIERIPANLPIEDGGQLEWWLYDNKGKQIDKSICAWEIKEDPTFQNVYLGRKPQEIWFKMGDIVEIVCKDKVFLSIINGLPPAIEEMWELYEERLERQGEKLDERLMNGDFSDAMKDMYFYIQSNGFDPDEVPYHIMRPAFAIPPKVSEELTGRFNRWKSYIDSHSYEEIDWDELYRIVKGEK